MFGGEKKGTGCESGIVSEEVKSAFYTNYLNRGEERWASLLGEGGKDGGEKGGRRGIT